MQTGTFRKIIHVEKWASARSHTGLIGIPSLEWVQGWACAFIFFFLSREAGSFQKFAKILNYTFKGPCKMFELINITSRLPWLIILYSTILMLHPSIYFLLLSPVMVGVGPGPPWSPYLSYYRFNIRFRSLNMKTFISKLTSNKFSN